MILLKTEGNFSFIAIKKEYTADYEGIDHGTFFHIDADNKVWHYETCQECEGVDFGCELDALEGYVGTCIEKGGFLPNPLVLLKPKQGTVFDFTSEEGEDFSEDRWKIVASLSY